MKRIVALSLSLLLILSVGCTEEQKVKKEENLPEKSAEEIKPKSKKEEKNGEIGWAKDVPTVTFKPNWEVETSAQEFLLELTAPKYQGRLTGSAGNQAAADYIEQQFVNFHLQKLPELESYRQSFYDDVFENLPGEAWIVSENGEERALQLGKDWVFRASFVEVDKTLPLSSNLSDCKADKAFLDGNVTKQDYPRNYIEVVSGDITEGKPYFNQGNAASTITVTPQIYEQLKQKNVKLHLKLPANAKEGTAENVVGCFPGKNKNRAVVLGAHFDGSGQCGTAFRPSAYDNASGMATILQAASWLSKAEDLPCDVIVAAFNGEESGLKGSETLAKYLIKEYEEILMVNIDCIGWKDDAVTIYGEGGEISLRNELAGGIGVSCKNKTYVGDNMSFLEQKIPTVTVSDEHFDEQKKERCIHTIYDTVENLDTTKMDQTAKNLCSWIIERGGNRIVRYPLYW